MKCLSILVVMLLSITAIVHSQEVIVISGHPEAKPFTWVNKEKKLVGFSVELAEKIFPDMKIRYEIRPWKRALAELEDGRIDLLLALYKNEERLRKFEFTLSYAEDPISVFVNKNNIFSLTQWDDLIQYKGCVPLGESYGGKLDRFINKKLDVEKAHTFMQCLQVLEKRRVNYVIFSKYHVQIELVKTGFSQIDVLPYNMTSQNVYMAFSKKSPFAKLVPKVNAEITRLTKDGTISKFLEKAILQASEE